MGLSVGHRRAPGLEQRQSRGMGGAADLGAAAKTVDSLGVRGREKPPEGSSSGVTDLTIIKKNNNKSLQLWILFVNRMLDLLPNDVIFIPMPSLCH